MSDFQMIINGNHNEKLLIPAKIKVAIINGDSSKPKCGIYQHGLSVRDLLFTNQHLMPEFIFSYESIANFRQFRQFVKKNKPDIYIFNGNAGTMPWLRAINLLHLSGIKIKLTHDITNYDAVFFSPFTFDFLLTDDLTVENTNPFVLKVGRLIQGNLSSGTQRHIELEKIKVGSFGLALPDKGFEEIIEKFSSQSGNVEFNFHMPKSDYMDSEGLIQKSIIDACKQRLRNTSCSLNISTDFKDKNQLVKFLESNDVNIFNYRENRGSHNQISGVTEYALAANRPFFVSKCAMFRNVTNISPHYFDFESLDIQGNLKDSFEKNLISQAQIREDWTDSGFIYDTKAALIYAVQNKYNARRWPRNIKDYVKNKIRDRFLRTNYNHLESIIRIKDGDITMPNLIDFPDNSILDHEKDGIILSSIIEDIKNTCNISVKNKVPVSLVQHAYVANHIMNSIKVSAMAKIACLGAYGDILSEYLKKKGYLVFDIDPNLNYTVEEYLQRNPNQLGTFDVCFSVSVLEHVPDDRGFISGAMHLLKPGGYMVNTVDYRSGEDVYMPPTHVRFYNALQLSNLLEIFGGPDAKIGPGWDRALNNFNYNNTSYTFATLCIKKSINEK